MTINIRSLGAVGDSATLNTNAIQRAIDSVSNSGGGTVLIDSGIYSTGTIRLKSNVTLRVTPGTKLKAPANNALYPDIPYNTQSWADVYTLQSMIFAEDASNIRITGGGIIDANGFQSYYLSLDSKQRPFGLRLHAINGLTIDSITLMQAPQWMCHMMGCTNVYVNALTLYNQCFGYNDGIDIDCCQNVLVENSDFDTNDDCIPVKTQSTAICRDVTIRNCTMASFQRPVKVGNESFGPIVNVHLENITVKQSAFQVGLVPLNAVYVSIADGGSADSIYISNINVNTPYQCAVFVRLCERDFQLDTSLPKPLPQYLRNVWISNVTCRDSTTIPSSVTGLPGYDVQNIYLKNINLTAPGGGPDVTGNLPEQAATRPEANIWGDSLPSYGLFIWHANGVYLDSFCVDTERYDQRPYYYCADTLNIPNLEPCSYYYIAGINEVAANNNELKVFPNPAADNIQVSNLPVKAEALLLRTLTGETLSIMPTLGRQQVSLDVSKLAPGLYILTAAGYQYSVNKKVLVIR